jgi:hypothetical protein
MGNERIRGPKNVPAKYRVITRTPRIINAGRVELSTKSQTTKGSL